MPATVFPNDMHTSASLHEAVQYVLDGKDAESSLPASIAFYAMHTGLKAEKGLSDSQRALLQRPRQCPFIPRFLPRMSITGYGYSTSNLGLCSVTMNQYMCDHCGELAKEMSRCVRCHHAHYCGKECQTAAWQGHKKMCKQIVAEFAEREQMRGRRLFYHDLYLVDMLHPDKLLQCRFWTRMLLSVLTTQESESNWEGRFIAMRHLIRFLWLFTAMPLGNSLILTLQQRVDDVRNALRRHPPQDATLAKDARLAADTLFYAMLHDESCQAIVLEGLPVLHAQQGWPHDAGREGELRCMLLHAFNVQPLRYERNTFWGPVMRPEVAKLQVTIAPRAVGLMGTAYARVHQVDEGARGQPGATQLFINMLVLHWLLKPWSSNDPIMQRCIAAGLTLPEQEPGVNTSGMNERALAGAQEAMRGLPADVARRYLRAASARVDLASEPPLADAARLGSLQGTVRALLRPNKEPCGNKVVVSSMVVLSPPVLQCVADPAAALKPGMTEPEMLEPMGAFGEGGYKLAQVLRTGFQLALRPGGSGRPLYSITEARVLHELDLGPVPREPQRLAQVLG